MTANWLVLVFIGALILVLSPLAPGVWGRVVQGLGGLLLVVGVLILVLGLLGTSVPR